jgi:hypothetical protein
MNEQEKTYGELLTMSFTYSNVMCANKNTPIEHPLTELEVYQGEKYCTCCQCN